MALPLQRNVWCLLLALVFLLGAPGLAWSADVASHPFAEGQIGQPPIGAHGAGEGHGAGVLRCPSIDTDDIEGFVQAWAEAVVVGNPDRVADLYADDALLLPTLSAVSRTGHAGIADYFGAFLARHPSVELLDHRLFSGCNEVVDAGTYRFHFHDNLGMEDGESLARYTFVYRHNGQGWQLVHHHSSLMPP